MYTSSFKNNVTHKQLIYKLYISNMCKQDLALNNLQVQIWRKTQPTEVGTVISHVTFDYKF